MKARTSFSKPPSISNSRCRRSVSGQSTSSKHHFSSGEYGEGRSELKLKFSSQKSAKKPAQQFVVKPPRKGPSIIPEHARLKEIYVNKTGQTFENFVNSADKPQTPTTASLAKIKGKHFFGSKEESRLLVFNSDLQQLRTTASPFSMKELFHDDTPQLIKLMKQFMRSEVGLGLAAPQINVHKQLILIDLPERGLSQFPFFNPIIEVQGSVQRDSWESCLSVPGWVGKVQRYNDIIVRFLDTKGKDRALRATGFMATVFQHECDHLKGQLFTDSVDPATLIDKDVFMKQGPEKLREIVNLEGELYFL